MNNPLVSIVLPTYNGEKYLSDAIQSCLTQTYTNIELIIVDDASDDETPEIIVHYSSLDIRVQCVRHDINRKLPATLNTGFKLAQGEYLTWISDDNCYREEAIAQMVAFLQSKKDVDIVYADYTFIDENGDALKSVSVGPPTELNTGNCVSACFLYRRAVQEKLKGYSEDLFGAEDYDFWLRASVFFKMEPLHQNLYMYRLHGGSLTNLQTQGIRLATEEALKRNLPHMDWLGSDFRAKGFVRLATMSHERSDLWSSRYYLLNGLRYSLGVVLHDTSFGLLADTLLGSTISNAFRYAFKKT